VLRDAERFNHLLFTPFGLSNADVSLAAAVVPARVDLKFLLYLS